MRAIGFTYIPGLEHALDSNQRLWNLWRYSDNFKIVFFRKFNSNALLPPGKNFWWVKKKKKVKCRKKEQSPRCVFKKEYKDYLYRKSAELFNFTDFTLSNVINWHSCFTHLHSTWSTFVCIIAPITLSLIHLFTTLI